MLKSERSTLCPEALQCIASKTEKSRKLGDADFKRRKEIKRNISKKRI